MAHNKSGKLVLFFVAFQKTLLLHSSASDTSLTDFFNKEKYMQEASWISKDEYSMQFNSTSTDSFGELNRPLIPASIRVRTLALYNAFQSETQVCQRVVLRKFILTFRRFS